MSERERPAAITRAIGQASGRAREVAIDVPPQDHQLRKPAAQEAIPASDTVCRNQGVGCWIHEGESAMGAHDPAGRMSAWRLRLGRLLQAPAQPAGPPASHWPSICMPQNACAHSAIGEGTMDLVGTQADRMPLHLMDLVKCELRCAAILGRRRQAGAGSTRDRRLLDDSTTLHGLSRCPILPSPNPIGGHAVGAKGSPQ